MAELDHFQRLPGQRMMLLSTNVGLRGKRRRKLGWGHPSPSRSLKRPQQSEQEGPCQTQEAEEGASNQPEFRHIRNAKQREVRDLKQLRGTLEKPHLLLPFPRFPSPLGRVRNQDWRDKAGAESPIGRKKVI